MDASLLPTIFRNALRASLVVPLLAACGGETTSPSSGSDGGERADTGTRVDTGVGRDAGTSGHDGGGLNDASIADGADGGCDPHEICDVGGCTCGSTTPVCVDGQWQCSCAACPPPVDSGNACKPTLAQCDTTSIALSCFDGGLPDATSQNMPSYGATCEALCGAQVGSCYVGTQLVEGGTIALQCTTYCATGRLFAGFRARHVRRGSPLHRHFATTAYLEAAAVDAFQILAGELAAHGAPADLVARAKDAARDEARHWKMTRPLALRYGACAKPKRAGRRPVRSLVDIALENSVEGCVRETYGAVVAHHQALAAHDEEVRKVMTAIAEDETRHAILSWELASWVDARLTAEERSKVARARTRAVRRMTKALSADVPTELVTLAGMPDAASAQRLAASLAQSLWS